MLLATIAKEFILFSGTLYNQNRFYYVLFIVSLTNKFTLSNNL